MSSPRSYWVNSILKNNANIFTESIFISFEKKLSGEMENPALELIITLIIADWIEV